MYKKIFTVVITCFLLLLGISIAFGANIMLSDDEVEPREVYSLLGKWDLSLDKKFSKIYKVNVPGCIGIEVPQLRDYRGDFYYRKRFNLKEVSEDSVYYLYFGSVNYYSEIWLNGQFIGFHEGGYTPFSFEITDKVKSSNELIVRVLLPTDNDSNYPFGEIPHGKQTWYGTAGGILGNVSLVKLSKDHIKNLYITPDIDNSKINVKGEIKLSNKSRIILFRIYDPTGERLGEFKFSASEKINSYVPISKLILWDIERPSLYKLEALIIEKDKVLDKFIKYFGMRKIEVKDGEILLNNKPIYIMGALDQDFYPDTHYIPPNEEFVKNELMLAKQMGLNCLRYHIKVPHPWYLKWADRLGILVWYDMPNWDRSTPKAKARGENLLEEMVAYDYNHPSVVIRTIINESWGLNLAGDYNDRKWLEDMYDKLKTLDPTRLVVDNSPCCNNFHVKTDINDFHNYFAFPDRFPNMKQWVSEYAKSPFWTFGSNVNRKGSEPLIVSEFGNWGLPDFSKLKAYYGGNPWWFSQGNIDDGTAPLGVEERFKDYGLDKIFTPSKFAQKFQELQHQALRFQIEEIRKHHEIKGYIITEFTDLYWECNGLLDITRGKKNYFNELKNINSLDLVFPKERPTGIWSGEIINIPILFSYLSDKQYSKIILKWQLIGTDVNGTIEDIKVNYGLNVIGNISLKAPIIREPRDFCISLGLIADGKLISQNFINLFVVPKDLIRNTRLKIAGYDERTKNVLKSLGIELYPIKDADVICSSTIDKNLDNYIKQGKKVIVDFAYEYIGYSKYITLRRSGSLEGNWVSGIGVLSPKLAGKTFPLFLDYRFVNDMPNHFLAGEVDFGKNTLGGMVIGWVTNPMNFVVEIRDGKGKVILTTFRLFSSSSLSPTLVALLWRMLKIL
ncbi:MAG: hypothetical protein N2380_08220 [bacterium]|nr:hypothetical protein [bacterium]